MVDDDLRAGKVARQIGRGVEVPPRRLQIEGQAVPVQGRVAAPPARVVHRTGFAAPRLGRRSRRTGLVPDAAGEGALGLPGDRVGRRLAVERRVGDDPAREAVTGGDRFEPSRFRHRRGPVPLGLDMDRAEDAVARRVRAVVGREIVAPEGAVVAIPERDGFGVAEPGVVVSVQVPEVLVSVDDRQITGLGHGQDAS